MRDIAAASMTGWCCVVVEVDTQILNFLIALHWLSERDAADARKIGSAIRDGLRLSARAVR
jgi:hypothetical protein